MRPARGVSSGSLLALLLLLAVPALAHIGYGPVTMDDATNLRRGVTELSIGGAFGVGATRRLRDFDYARVPLDVRYGWRDDLEIGFSGSYDVLGGASELDDVTGFGDPFFRVKYLLTPVTARATGMAVEGEFGVSLDQGVGTGGNAVGILATASTPFRSGLGHLRIGYRARGGEEDLFRWGVAYDRPLYGRTRVVGEVFGGEGEEAGIEDDIVAQVGLKGRLDETWDWRLAGGVGVGGGAPEYVVRFGTAKEFGEASGSGAAGPGEFAGEPPWAPLQKSHEGARALADGDPARALILLRESLAADSEQAAAWNNVGVAYARLGRPAEARSAFQEALDRGGEDADILTNLGFSLFQAGDYAGARLALARAAALDPARADLRAAVAALGPAQIEIGPAEGGETP